MSDQTATADRAGGELRAAVQALIDEDLNDRDLAARLRSLLPSPEDIGDPPTTDDAVDHPGYQ
jgi:hypothetical protein